MMKRRLQVLFLTAFVSFAQVAEAEVIGKDLLDKQKQAAKVLEGKKIKREQARDYTQIKVETKACEDTDIMGGMWKMIYFKETPPRRHSKFNRKINQQYLMLRADSYYARLRSRRSLDDAEKAKRIIKPDTRPGFEQKFLLNHKDKGTEIIFMEGKTPLYRHSCRIVTVPTAVFKKGDMILTGYTRGAGTLLYELYRRWF